MRESVVECDSCVDIALGRGGIFPGVVALALSYPVLWYRMHVAGINGEFWRSGLVSEVLIGCFVPRRFHKHPDPSPSYFRLSLCLVSLCAALKIYALSD